MIVFSSYMDNDCVTIRVASPAGSRTRVSFPARSRRALVSVRFGKLRVALLNINRSAILVIRIIKRVKCMCVCAEIKEPRKRVYRTVLSPFPASRDESGITMK